MKVYSTRWIPIYRTKIGGYIIVLIFEVFSILLMNWIPDRLNLKYLNVHAIVCNYCSVDSIVSTFLNQLLLSISMLSVLVFIWDYYFSNDVFSLVI